MWWTPLGDQGAHAQPCGVIGQGRATPKGDAAGLQFWARILQHPMMTYVQAIIQSRPIGPLMTLDSSMMNLSIVDEFLAPLGNGRQFDKVASTLEYTLGDTDIRRAFDVLGYAYAVPFYLQVDVTILDVHIDSLYCYAFDSVHFHGVVLLLLVGGCPPGWWGVAPPVNSLYLAVDGTVNNYLTFGYFLP